MERELLASSSPSTKTVVMGVKSRKLKDDKELQKDKSKLPGRFLTFTKKPKNGNIRQDNICNSRKGIPVLTEKKSGCLRMKAKCSEPDIYQRRFPKPWKFARNNELELVAKRQKLDEKGQISNDTECIQSGRQENQKQDCGNQGVTTVQKSNGTADDTLAISKSFVIPEGKGYLHWRYQQSRSSYFPSPVRPMIESKTIQRGEMTSLSTTLPKFKEAAMVNRPGRTLKENDAIKSLTTSCVSKDKKSITDEDTDSFEAIPFNRNLVISLESAMDNSLLGEDNLRTASSLFNSSKTNLSIRDITNISASTFIVETRTERAELMNETEDISGSVKNETDNIASVHDKMEPSVFAENDGREYPIKGIDEEDSKGSLSNVKEVVKKLRKSVKGKKEEKKAQEGKCSKTKRKSQKNNVCLKIYRRCVLRDLCGRRRRMRTVSLGSTEEDSPSSRGSSPERYSNKSVLERRNSQPWTTKGFKWKKQNTVQRGDKSVSVTSSLAHMNFDDSEEFSFWERIPTVAATLPWEATLYKWKRSWSVLSMTAFRNNRLSDTPGEMLQILRNEDDFCKGSDPPVHKFYPAAQENFAPADIEPSIFQKKIDVTNWLVAQPFYGTSQEEKDLAVTAEGRSSDGVAVLSVEGNVPEEMREGTMTGKVGRNPKEQWNGRIFESLQWGWYLLPMLSLFTTIYLRARFVVKYLYLKFRLSGPWRARRR